MRDSNLSKTFNVDVSKEALEKQFGINAEREKYYKDVATEIEVEPTGTGKKKSVLADLKAKKEDVAKQPRKKRIIDMILSIMVYTFNSYKEDSYAAIGRAA